MLPLYEMLMKANNGEAMQQMARQFGLSNDQVAKAWEALLPAFSEGLRRNASNPWDLGSFMQALATGGHQKYFDDITKAMSPQGVAEGNGILGHLFGSKELSRAVAAQAEAASGIQQAVLKQLLPVLASTIMGGLFKQSTGQFGAAGMGNNPFAEVIEQMMRQQGQYRQPQAPQQTAPDPFDNPFGKILKDMMGGGTMQPQPRQQAPQNPWGDNPWGKIFEEMMRGGQAQPAPRPQPEPAPRTRTNPSGRKRTPYDDLFGDMFDTGREVRDHYQRNVESIFDQYLQGMDRRARGR